MSSPMIVVGNFVSGTPTAGKGDFICTHAPNRAQGAKEAHGRQHGCRLYAAKVKYRNGRPMLDEGVVVQNGATEVHICNGSCAAFQARCLEAGMQAVPFDLVHWMNSAASTGSGRAVPGLSLNDAVS